MIELAGAVPSHRRGFQIFHGTKDFHPAFSDLQVRLASEISPSIHPQLKHLPQSNPLFKYYENDLIGENDLKLNLMY